MTRAPALPFGLLAAAAFLGGMIAAVHLGPAPATGVAAATGATIAGLRDLRRSPSTPLLIALVGLALIGVWRYEAGLPHPEDSGIARLNDRGPVEIEAVVDAPPEERGATTRLRLEARALLEADRREPLDGTLLATVPPYPEYRYGDVLRLIVEPETPPTFDGFDYREYLARQGIGSTALFPDARLIGAGSGNPVRERVFEVRTYLADVLGRELAEPEAGLAQGMTLGVRRAIAQDLRDDLNATGTSHLVVISGQNVAILAALVIAAVAWLIGRRQAGLVALAVVVAYTLLAGADPPVLRGAIMGGAWTVATLAGRRASAAVALALAAAGLAAFDPAILNDVSFQLSFAATTGLVTLAGPLNAWGRAILRLPDASSGPAAALVEAAAVTTAATVATAPIIALNFGRIALVSLPANLVLVPLFPLILAFTTLTAVLGGLWAPLGSLFAPITWLLLHTMVEVVRFFADAPLASAEVDGFGLGHALVAYAVIVSVAWLLRVRRPAAALVRATPRWAPAARRSAYAALGGSLTAVLLLGAVAAGQDDGADGRIEVSFLDVGQGDAAIIRAPGGRTVLIDGGPDGQRLARELGATLPPRDRSIDMVIVTHADADHATGLVEVLRRFDVGAVLLPERGEGSAFAALLAQARASDVPVAVGRAGQRYDLDGARLQLLGPTNGRRGSDNDASLVVRLRYGDADVLFAADVEAAGEQALVAAGAAADVLKVAHHGSSTSSAPTFLAAVGAQVAVVSVGESNRYGHPDTDVMERLMGAIPHVYRTDQNGRIVVETDGETIWVRSER